MGKQTPGKFVPAKVVYHNILTKDKFKDILEFCLSEDNEFDVNLVEQLLAGALAAVELDCIADVRDENLDAELTAKHYLKYIEIAGEAIRTGGADREDIRAFMNRINKLCSTKSSQETFL